MTTLADTFENEGELQKVAANQPLHLDDAASVWLVKSGRIELFSTSSADGQFTGSRLHLGTVAPGGLLFGTARDREARSQLLATGIPGTEVLRLPADRFQQLTGSRPAVDAVGGLVDQWIELLTTAATRDAMPRVTAALEATGEVSLKAGTVASPPRTMWVAATSAPCRFLSQTRLAPGEEGDVFPLADAGWLETTAETTVRGMETGELLGTKRFWRGLEQFHASIVRCVQSNAEESAQRERIRLGKKALADQEKTAVALSRLASATQSEDVTVSSLEPGQDPLLAACRIIGARLKITIRPPTNYGEMKLDDPVSAIARAAGTRIRRVALAGTWWREDNGPLLAFLRDGNQPVALVPSAGGYAIINPATGERRSVTDEVRRELGWHAFTFYRSFDPRPINPSKVLKFSLFGTTRDWGILVLLGMGAAVLGLFVPVATGLIISNIIPATDRQQLFLLVAALVVNAIVIALFEFVQEIATLRVEARMDSSVEAGVWDRLLNLPASFFRQYSTGDLAMRAMGIGYIRQVLTQAAMSSLLSFVFSLVTFVLLFYYDVRLALIGTLLFLVVVGATVLTAFIQLPIERMQHEVRGKVAGIVLQLLTGISRLRVAGAEDRALAYWAGHYSRQVRLAYRSQMVSNGLATFMSSVPVLSTMALFVTVASFPSESLSLAAFLAFSAAFAQVMGAAMSVGSTISSILEVVPLYERSKPILETLPESLTAKGDPGLLSGRIEIGHASFRYYPDGPLVLDDVSMEIRPGEFVAFVGPSGAGKSTILRLLLGFESPEKGSIYYDDEDFAQLDRQAVRRQIGVVFQNSRLTSGDIFRNIVGSAPLTLDDAWEAARLSGLDDDINQMPMGMHTVISEGESTLSGGQRQRLLIARAIVTRPKMLFFDEATSALDNVTQAKVASSLESFKATRVVIAHRLSTIMNADRIYVIKEGKLVQQGQYDELLSAPGLFAELARRQLI